MSEPLPQFAEEALRAIRRVRESAEKVGAELKDIEANLIRLLPEQWDAEIEERFGPMLRNTIGTMTTLERAITSLYRDEGYLAPLRRMLADRFGGPECFDNLSTLLAFHAWSDRMLTLLIFSRLEKAHPTTTASDLLRLINVIADIGFSARIDLAESLQYVGSDVTAGLRELNALRNRLAHWKARKRRVDDEVSELTTDAALRGVIPNCVAAAIGLSAAMDATEEGSDGPTR